MNNIQMNSIQKHFETSEKKSKFQQEEIANDTNK